MSALQKNVASQIIFFGLVNVSTGAALTGAAPAGFIAKDSGAQASTAGTYTGLGNGQYKYAPTQAETNATAVGILHTASNAIPVSQHFFTIGYDPTAAVVPANTTQFAGQTVTAAAGVTLPASVASPTNITAGTIDTVKDLTVNTFAEPTAVPAATATIKDKIGWLQLLARNLVTQTSTTETVYRTDDTTPVATSTDSDNGTTFSRGRWT